MDTLSILGVQRISGVVYLLPGVALQFATCLFVRMQLNERQYNYGFTEY